MQTVDHNPVQFATGDAIIDTKLIYLTDDLSTDPLISPHQLSPRR